MAGHSAIDAEAEAHYAKEGLGSGLSFAVVALKVAKNLASGSLEMLDRLAVFEWSYKIQGDHLATPEGDRFSKLIATEQPLQRALLQSVERDFISDPSVRQKIVVSVDNPTVDSPDAQRRSYIYIYTRDGDEIKAQSIESFADDKALRVLLKQLGCNDDVRAVEDGKVLIEPTSIRRSRDCLTLERVNEVTRLVSEAVSRTERSQDLVNRLQWYVENRDLAIQQRELDTERRLSELLKGGVNYLVESSRAQASELNRAIVGGQALAQQLHREENKDRPILHEYVRVTRPEGISVIGADALSQHFVNLDRISVLGWGNMARWSELLGLTIPSRQAPEQARDRAANPRAALSATRERGDFKTAAGNLSGSLDAKRLVVLNADAPTRRGSGPASRAAFERDGVAATALGASLRSRVGDGGLYPRLKSATPRPSEAEFSQSGSRASVSTARLFSGRQRALGESAGEAKERREFAVRGVSRSESLGSDARRGLARARVGLNRILGRGGGRIHRMDVRFRGKAPIGRRLEPVASATRRFAPSVRANAKSAGIALALARRVVSQRVGVLLRPLMKRIKALSTRDSRPGYRSASRWGIQIRRRTRGLSISRMRVFSRTRIRSASKISRLRVLRRSLQLRGRGETRFARGASPRGQTMLAYVWRLLAARFSVTVRRGANKWTFRARETRPDVAMPAMVSYRRMDTPRGMHFRKGGVLLTERPRQKGTDVREVARSILSFVEWLLLQTRASRTRASFAGSSLFMEDSAVARMTEGRHEKDDTGVGDPSAELARESTDESGVEGVSQGDERQEQKLEESAPLLSAEPRWELSIFTARQFDSQPHDSEAVSLAT